MNFTSSWFQLTLFILLLLGLERPVCAQAQFAYSADAEREFASALRLFRGGNYRESAKVLEGLTHAQPPNQRTTGAFVMLGKALDRMGEHERAEAVLRGFLARYMNSSYVDDGWYTLGTNLLAQEKYQEAATAFLHVIDHTSDSTLQANSERFFDLLGNEQLQTQDLQQLLNVQQSSRVQLLVRAKLAERYFKSGDLTRARAIIEQDSVQIGDQRYRDRIERLRTLLRGRSSVTVGVLLPLLKNESANPIKMVADDVLAGIEFAVNEFRQDSSVTAIVTLDTRDTERDPLKARFVMSQFVADPGVAVVVGPLFSAEALAVAPMAEESELPMITPTATANGIAATGAYVFQANPDGMRRGIAMARYAVIDRGFTLLAVVTPGDSSVRSIAEAFASEATHLGASIVAFEVYDQNKKDLRDNLMQLRQSTRTLEPRVSFADLDTAQIASIIAAGATPTMVDSLLMNRGSVGVRRLFGEGGVRLADSLGLPVVKYDSLAESLESPLEAIQAIFVPIVSPDFIGVVGSQLAYFNIRTVILGNGEWEDLAQLDANKRYVDGVEFLTDTYIDPALPSYGEFVNGFTEKQKRLPTKYTLYGYDVMKLILEQILRGATTRRDLARSFAAVERFRGIHSLITFRHARVNPHLHVLQYHAGELRKRADISGE
jgi:ABC-type branched-subunit amino acid transport system substrate-binding protein